MNKLVKIFSKYYVLILFIFLESLSVVFIFQGKNYHRSLFINTVNDATGNTLSIITNYKDYLNLTVENERLNVEISQLRKFDSESITKINSTYTLISDSIYRQTYTYLDAKVITSTINKKNNYILINKGKRDGVNVEMGLITAQGVVGRIVSVSENYAKAMSFLHKDAGMFCKITRTEATGILQWDGSNSEEALLIDLPLTTDVVVGDSVITSGYSFTYPKGIPMGLVKEVKENQSNQMLEVRVKLSLNYNELSQILIVESLDKDELDKLQKDKP